MAWNVYITQIVGNKAMNWIKCSDRLPELVDDSVIVYFAESGSIEFAHIQDYFKDITAGMDEHGNQKYTKWYLMQGVTHWMPPPKPPAQHNADRGEG